MIEIILSICLGVGLAASVGFRVFLPLLAVSIAAYFQIIPLNENWQWVGSITALILLSVATVIEILAYYIPWFDNLLDTIALPLAGIAGTAVMMSTLVDLSPMLTWTLAIIAGGGTAATVKGTMGTSRAASSVVTGGIANPIIATVETGTATVMSTASIFAAPLAIFLLIFLFFGLRKLYRKLFSRSS